ncbi:hypothetical protein QLX08_004503 [Tetragonisca angustula]|uniref:Uncharacterized protein n=1 Tax=Tetragonisca angustula TaxID=166442 RepID=A0AAW1A1V7_9HYME
MAKIGKAETPLEGGKGREKWCHGGQPVFSRQNDNSGRRRRDESNWRKEGPDTAQREEPKNGTRRGTRNAKWQEGIGCTGTNETTHN